MQPGKTPPPFGGLTPRETGAPGLVGAGPKNREVSSRLPVRKETVGDHLSKAFREPAVAGRARATVRAREAGMGGEPKG